MTLSDTIRAELILAAETTSLRKIAEAAGIKYASLDFFYRGVRGLSVASLERLAGEIGLVISVRKKRSG